SGPSQASTPTCGDTKQLQPTKLAANAPIKSVLIQPHLRGRATLAVLAADSPFALVAYQSRKYVKCKLSLLAWPSAALSWLMFANVIFVAILFGKAHVAP